MVLVNVPVWSLEYFDEFISEINIDNLISTVDLVIDGSDNFKTRYLLSDFCFEKNIPYAFAALYKNEGQLGILTTKKYGNEPYRITKTILAN